MPEIDPVDLAQELRGSDPPLVVDVREPEEWAIGHLAAAHLIPKGELAERVDELTKARELVLYCRSGKRSGEAARLLLDLGFSHVKSLRGGINAWSQQVDPTVPQY